MNKAQMLAYALDDLLAVSPEVDASAVVSADGLPMASALPPNVAEDRLAAMSAALLTLGERAAAGLGKGDLQQVFIEGSNGHVILMAAGPDAVLVAVTGRGSKIGLVLFEMRKVAAKVGEIIAAVPEEVHHAPEPPQYQQQPAYAEPAYVGAPQYPQADQYQEADQYPQAEHPEPAPPEVPQYPASISVRHPEPTPAAEVIQPSVSAWE